MSFLGKARLKNLLGSSSIIDTYVPKLVEGASYPLTLADEHFITSFNSAGSHKRSLDDKISQLVIPPGQVALLMTHERVSIPTDIVAFITVKVGIKWSGLVNISGFHVDPGFKGRLKFTVFNAGASNVILDRGQKCFSIMFCDLSEAVPGENAYDGKFLDQESITATDIKRLEGEFISPHLLRKEFDEVKSRLDKAEKIAGEAVLRRNLFITIALGLLITTGTIAYNGWKDARAEELIIEKAVREEVERAIEAQTKHLSVTGATRTTTAQPASPPDTAKRQ